MAAAKGPTPQIGPLSWVGSHSSPSLKRETPGRAGGGLQSLMAPGVV
jgi:hypothetical protein